MDGQHLVIELLEVLWVSRYSVNGQNSVSINLMERIDIFDSLSLLNMSFGCKILIVDVLDATRCTSTRHERSEAGPI